jgi:hypothetical protein
MYKAIATLCRKVCDTAFHFSLLELISSYLVMGLLSQHIIHGAAHDDSARTPPPRCHPNTRVKVLDRLTAWFEGQAQEELLLWITGPAGVGKSAIVQTFAEYLAKSKSLGASVFISRPNKRNNPHGIFITIAFQLATRIEEYREFVVERLSLDPSLVNKDMEAQFSTFIVEPFVERKVGADGKRWGILLDGLDELRGDDAQCNIIQLISTFVHEHPDVPLLWIIASRPESHISNTFEDDEVRPSYWSEYIPIDSTEACEDVERFLRSSFKAIQKKFRQSVSSDWPSDADFLKVTVAASGLFVYAEVVMQFIRDSNQADPVTRFEVLLSVIDRSSAVPTNDNPFVHLDALYHEILSAIPLTLWPAAKRLLGFTIHDLSIYRYEDRFHTFQTLRGMSLLLDLSRHTVYACLIKCRSTLRIPDWKTAHKEKLTILHASFSDYLQDPDRSGKFHIGDQNSVEEGVQLKLLGIWTKCSGHDIPTGMLHLFVLVTNTKVIVVLAAVEYTWHQYCSKLDDGTPSKAVAKFHSTLFRDFIDRLEYMACRILDSPREPVAYMQLQKVHMVKLCYYFGPYDLHHFVFRLVNNSMPSASLLDLTVFAARYV